MPKYRITGPDGGTYEINAPEGATEAQVLEFAKQNYGGAKPRQRVTAEEARDPSKISAERYRAAGIDPPGRADGSSGSWYGDYLAGVGRSLVDTGRGAAQYVVDATAGRGTPTSGLDAAAGLVGMIPGVRDAAARQSDKMRAEEAERRRLLPSFTENPSFTAGNVVGTLGQLVVPGAAARGTAAVPALLPTTVRGNALQGALLGATQPVAAEGERTVNTGVGGFAGALGAGIPRAATGGINALRSVLGGQTLSGAERAAGQQIADVAADRAAIMAAQPSQVPGVVRTLGEETQDAGIAGLENMLRGRVPGQFGPIDLANNAARVRALQSIAGTDADMAAADAARDQATGTLRDTAFREGQDYARMSGLMQDLERARLMLQAQDVAALNMANAPLRAVGGAAPFPVMTQQQIEQQVAGVSRTDLSPLVGRLRDISSSNSGNPAVQSTLDRVDSALGDARNSVSGLYNVRKYIDALLTGKAGNETTAARSATSELMAMKEAIDSEIASRAPTFTDYLGAYRAMSQPINRMEMGRELLNRGSGPIPDVLGNEALQPGRLFNATNDLDGLAARATGFSKAKAEDILTAQDLSLIRSIQDDMQRISARGSSPMVGSRTDANQELGRQAARGALNSLPVVGRFSDFLEQRASAQVQEKLAYLVANPAEARRVLAALPDKDKATLNRALLQLSARAGVAAPTLAE